MIKKHKLSNIKSIWFYFHNLIASLRKFYYKNEFFVRFSEFTQNGLNKSYCYPPQKEMLSYITSRNMRRTIVPSDFMKENLIPTQKTILNFSNKKETVGLVRLNIQQPKKYILNILNFHSKTMLSGNLISKQITKKETQEELEISWGGREIYKLITFIKNFDETVKNHSEVMIFFSAHWCQHCQRLRKPYGNAALMAKRANLPVLFSTFDITDDPDVALENGIVGIPLIVYYKKGKYFSTFKGKRTAEELFEFAKNPPKPSPGNEIMDI